MENIEHKPKVRSLKKKIGIFFGYLLLTILVVACVAHFVWKYSGSNKWEYDREIDGVKVYSMKTPGEVFTKFKLEGVFHTKLAGLVKLMRDPNTCDDVGCTNSYVIETKDFPKFVTYTFRYPMPSPFKPREFVVVSEFTQHPDTKEIYVDYKSVNDKLPPNDCCVRVPRMNNSWRFKPIDEDTVSLEYIYDNPPGGMAPYFLINAGLSSTLYQTIGELQVVLNTEKYKSATVDYVKEVEQL